MTKKLLAVLLFGCVAIAPAFAQKFTKREQARREARENYYFCGNMFTFTAGYNHSWLTPSSIKLTTTNYGKSEKLTNTNNNINLGFLWDHAFKHAQKWSLQHGLYYSNKGGEHLYYYDNGLGAGPQIRTEETKKIHVQNLELQSVLRYTFLIAHDQRITANAGLYVDKMFDTPAGIKNWDFGGLIGVGYDYKHISASITYQPGCYPNIADNCNTRQANISFNVGYRLWKK